MTRPASNPFAGRSGGGPTLQATPSTAPLLDWQPTYPCQPGTKARDTSGAAGDGIAGHAKQLREQVWAMFKDGAELTADEAADRLGASILSIRPRFSELVARGLIDDTGRRHKNGSGRNAIVWRAR